MLAVAWGWRDHHRPSNPTALFYRSNILYYFYESPPTLAWGSFAALWDLLGHQSGGWHPELAWLRAPSRVCRRICVQEWEEPEKNQNPVTEWERLLVPFQLGSRKGQQPEGFFIQWFSRCDLNHSICIPGKLAKIEVSDLPLDQLTQELWSRRSHKPPKL